MNHLMMETTVTQLLREFPKIRRAALRGERVVIRTRGGNLVLQREAPEKPLLGSLAGQAEDRGLTAEDRAFSSHEWGE